MACCANTTPAIAAAPRPLFDASLLTGTWKTISPGHSTKNSWKYNADGTGEFYKDGAFYGNFTWSINGAIMKRRLETHLPHELTITKLTATEFEYDANGEHYVNQKQ